MIYELTPVTGLALKESRTHEHRADPVSLVTLVGQRLRRFADMLRLPGSHGWKPAPAAPNCMVYVLCEEYRRLDLWTAYHAFRLDPNARTWQRLRRRRVPWQRETTVEALVQRMCPMTVQRTPDASAVGMAVITAATPSRPR